MLADPVVNAIAQHHERTPGQIVLRWQVQSGYIPIPKSGNPERQADNLNIFDFTLGEADMMRLDRPDPDMLDADSFGH